MTKRVLIIEDSAKWQGNYRKALPTTIEIVEARTLAEARDIVDQIVNSAITFDAIVFDGCLHGSDPDTTYLIMQLKDFGFKGPMITGSSNPRMNTLLMGYGCTNEARIKEEVASVLLNALGLTK